MAAIDVFNALRRLINMLISLECFILNGVLPSHTKRLTHSAYSVDFIECIHQKSNAATGNPLNNAPFHLTEYGRMEFLSPDRTMNYLACALLVPSLQLRRDRGARDFGVTIHVFVDVPEQQE